MSRSTMQTEPIRLPARLYALVLVVGPVAIALLTGADAKAAAATVIAGLIAGGGVIARAESIRARTDSPATIESRYAAHAATVVATDAADTTSPDLIDLSTPPATVAVVTMDDLSEQLADVQAQMRNLAYPPPDPS